LFHVKQFCHKVKIKAKIKPVQRVSSYFAL